MLRLRSWLPAGWLTVKSDRYSIFLTSFPYSVATEARSSMLSDSRISSRYSVYVFFCMTSTNSGFNASSGVCRRILSLSVPVRKSALNNAQYEGFPPLDTGVTARRLYTPHTGSAALHPSNGRALDSNSAIPPLPPGTESQLSSVLPHQYR